MNNSILGLLFVIVLIALVVFVGSSNSFGSRCKEAGYSGAQFELCVKRAANGGPIYEENIERWEYKK